MTIDKLVKAQGKKYGIVIIDIDYRDPINAVLAAAQQMVDMLNYALNVPADFGEPRDGSVTIYDESKNLSLYRLRLMKKAEHVISQGRFNNAIVVEPLSPIAESYLPHMKCAR